MWISTITIDLVNFRDLDPVAMFGIYQSIEQKKLELRETDGGGSAVEGFPGVDNLSELQVDQSTRVIKRAWNTESAAREFASFVQGLHSAIMSTSIEEQV